MLFQLIERGARAEGTWLAAAEYDHASIRIDGQGIERRGETAQQISGERIALGVAELDRRDPVGRADDDVPGVEHRRRNSSGCH